MEASVSVAINVPAARYCDRLEFGGFDDWYLPSKNELGLIYMNLKVDGIGGFGNGWYWTSSEVGDGDRVWVQQFSDGQQQSGYWSYNPGHKNQAFFVRAIRQF